jgi:rhomboid family GlyGly-CTERM serine protease
MLSADWHRKSAKTGPAAPSRWSCPASNRRIITKWAKWIDTLSESASFADFKRLRYSISLLGLLIAILVALYLLGDAGRDALKYERAAILNGEYWRLISGHFVHGTAQHLLLNVAGLLLISALFPRDYSARGWLIVVSTSIFAIDVGFVFYEPQLHWYVGFSGVLHGALAAGAFAWWRTEPKPLSLGLGGVLLGKLVWEQWRGALPLSGDLPVVVDAHLYGAIGGALGASILWASRQRWFSGNRSL